jgi:lipopolysaccharide transport system permease protein
MAHKLDSVAKLPSPTQWQRLAGLLTTRRGGLRLYQWLWVLLCVVASLVVVMPRALSRPVIYLTSAETRFDVTRYAGFYGAEGQPSQYFSTAQHDATLALQLRYFAEGELRFGDPDYRVAYIPQEPGLVHVQGIGPTAETAAELANEGAEELVRQIRAAGGREVLRNLLGSERSAAFHGEAAETRFQQYLRDIIEYNAFPMSRPIEPMAERIRVGNLPRAEQQDLTRALESRYDLWTFEITLHDTELDAACHTAQIVTTAMRENAIRICAANNPAVLAELEARNEAITKRNTIEAALRYMLDEQGATFQPGEPSAAYRVAADAPAAPESRHIGMFFILAVVAGVGFGALGVAVDRNIRVMPKLNELWAYRELIRNMVLRDLRIRYKGSTLGYLWTQIAPLLMMLVFLFVFTVLIPSNIALFPVFLIVALLPWNYCAEAVGGGTRSVLDNAHLIKKVFFPREVLPLSSVFSALVNFLLSLPMMFLVIAITQLLMIGRLNFSWTFAYLPVLVVIQTIFLAGVVFFVSALAVFFRDTVHLIGILLQFWFFLTPVFYSLDMIGERVARVIRWLNPMASLVDFYRDILYGGVAQGGMLLAGQIPTPGLPALDSVLRVTVTSLIVLAFGYWVFQRHSGQFGEEL